jgi:hypothetical protein
MGRTGMGIKGHHNLLTSCRHGAHKGQALAPGLADESSRCHDHPPLTKWNSSNATRFCSHHSLRTYLHQRQGRGKGGAAMAMPPAGRDRS